jgi:hypothetical protein
MAYAQTPKGSAAQLKLARSEGTPNLSSFEGGGATAMQNLPLRLTIRQQQSDGLGGNEPFRTGWGWTALKDYGIVTVYRYENSRKNARPMGGY